MKLSDILSGSAYDLAVFAKYPHHIDDLENAIDTSGKSPKVKCLIRNKNIVLKPEEVIRQLYLRVLINEYSYEKKLIGVEIGIQMGRGKSKKKADIVIYEKDRLTQAYIIVEVKRPKLLDGKEQLMSYCRASGGSIGVWTNGNDIEYYYKRERERSKTTILDKLTYLPNSSQTLSDVLNISFTIKNLIMEDALKDKSLREVILQFEQVVLANSGVNSFEEIFKLIFAKLYDEYKSAADTTKLYNALEYVELKDVKDDTFRQLEFISTGTETEVKKRIEKLFLDAKKKWQGIFSETATIEMAPSHLKTCVSYLQDVKLFNSNLEVIDDAFEYLVTKEQKSSKGQYFTPRYVIDMCVKMLHPQSHESMIDTAAGSCGFPMHSIFHVWRQLNPEHTHLLTNQQRSQAEKDYVKEKVFAIDFDLRSVRIGRTLNLIAGDGETNVLLLNTLDYRRWVDTIKERNWLRQYNEGFTRLEKYKQDKEGHKKFDFDILMANPPFAGDISDGLIISAYEQVGKKKNDKWKDKVGRDILFIERNLNFLKSGGRMAIVLPQGRFNNASDKYIREYIAKHCRILAVVGLHGNTFKPHTGTKTSVLFVQKWDNDQDSPTYCPKVEDYNIFFATQQKAGKNNKGDKIYVLDDEGKRKKDRLGHHIIDHDLFNHEKWEIGEKKHWKIGETQDGIAEAFIKFAEQEKLSFWSGK